MSVEMLLASTDIPPAPSTRILWPLAVSRMVGSPEWKRIPLFCAVYGAAIRGNASKCHLDRLLKQQKKAIRKVYNLKYKDHTNDYFIQANILKVPELMDYTTLSYIQSGLFERSPDHIPNLWNIKSNNLHILRDRGMQIEVPFTKKEWIRKLAPFAQAQLWNTTASKVEWDIDPIYFKKQLKALYMSKYLPPNDA